MQARLQRGVAGKAANVDGVVLDQLIAARPLTPAAEDHTFGDGRRRFEHLIGNVCKARDGRKALLEQRGALAFTQQQHEIDHAGDQQRARHHQRQLAWYASWQELLQSFVTSAEKL